MTEPGELAVVIDSGDSVWQRLDGQWYEVGDRKPVEWAFLLRHRQPLRLMQPVEPTP